jgi:HlyD family secretion protein
MMAAHVRDLSECTELRLSLVARPPRFVHGAVVLLVVLLASVVGWLYLTEANLVVRAPGRVRPVTTPTRVFSPWRGEVVGVAAGTRIIEVNVHEGDEVHRGDVLLRLDTERLDNELAKRQRTIRAAEEELARLEEMEGMLERQYEATKVKLRAELEEAEGTVARDKKSKDADLRLAEADRKAARDAYDRLLRLQRQKAIARDELLKAWTQVHQAEQQLAHARLPVNEGKVAVLLKALYVADKDYQVRHGELQLKRSTRQAELDAARYDLTNLQMERDQTVLRAPIDGVLTSGDYKVGDILEPGKPVMEIAGQRGFRFEVAVPSDEVGKLRVGLPVRIRLDAFDYQKYGVATGTVCYIAPDSALTREHAAPVYLVKVMVEENEIGRGDYHGAIKLGMAGQAEIITEQERLLMVLLRTIRQSISLS